MIRLTIFDGDAIRVRAKHPLDGVVRASSARVAEAEGVPDGRMLRPYGVSIWRNRWS